MTLFSQTVLVRLWMLGMFAQACLLALLVARKAYREYPAFTAFIAFCVLRSSVLFYVAHSSSSHYETVMWVAYLPQLVLLLMLVLEVFHIVFHPYETLPKGTLAHFIEAMVAVGVVVIGFVFWHPGTQPTPWKTFLRAMDQSTAWVLCAIFAFIALFSGYFGIPWRHRVYGIGIGFLFYLSVDVAVTTVVAQHGLAASGMIWPLDMLAFLGACVIWACYFATSEAPRPVPTLEQLNRVHAVLDRIAVSFDQERAGATEYQESRMNERSRGPGKR